MMYKYLCEGVASQEQGDNELNNRRKRVCRITAYCCSRPRATNRAWTRVRAELSTLGFALYTHCEDLTRVRAQLSTLGSALYTHFEDWGSSHSRSEPSQLPGGVLNQRAELFLHASFDTRLSTGSVVTKQIFKGSMLTRKSLRSRTGSGPALTHTG